MPKNFYTKVETSEGDRIVHVNRRGCKGRWTKKDQEMLEALVRAVHATTPGPSTPLSAARPVIRTPSALFRSGPCSLCGFKTDAVGRGRTGARNSHYAKHLRAGELLRRTATPADLVPSGRDPGESAGGQKP